MNQADPIPRYEFGSCSEESAVVRVCLGARVGTRGFRRVVSIWSLHEVAPSEPEAQRRFADAAVRFAGTPHSAVLGAEDVFGIGGRIFVATQPFRGKPLARTLEALVAAGRPVSVDAACAFVGHVAEAAAAALASHRGRASFCGISPETVWVGSDGYPTIVPGLGSISGRELGAVRRSHPSRYLAPELESGGESDERADVYALAVLLWDLLAMGRTRAPDDLATTNEVVAITGDRLVRIAMRSLAARPDDRPPTLAAFATEIFEAVPLARSARPVLAAGVVRLDELTTSELEPEAAPLRPLPAPIRRLKPAAPSAPRRGPPRPAAKSVPPETPRFCLIRGDAKSPLLSLAPPSTRWVVGRSHSADFVVDDPDVSREHFEVVHEGGAYRLYDLGSKNGLL
ncbi:MAG TPA: FHA domain-containing protein, partial [Polyangiaceae bacterium]|nr:FHA domain-containing protein [Polyangiaceae bacterium]